MIGNLLAPCARCGIRVSDERGRYEVVLDYKKKDSRL